MPSKIYDVIILGAGPAGLSAAIYARRANKSVLILESKTYGGQMVNTTEIENYPATPHIAGPELSKKLYDQAMEFGTDFEYEEALEIKNTPEFKLVKTDDGEYQGRTVIIATGSEEKKLGLPLEDKLIGRGVSCCATCDGAFYKGKVVAVAGGGNTALYSALYLADLAKKVHIIHRRNKFRGDEILVERLKKKTNVEYLMESRISALLEENNHLSGIELQNTTDDSAPAHKLPLDGLFVEIGRTPDTKRFASLVDLAPSGYIVADEHCRTSVPGIFAAGDVREKSLRQIVTAASDGAVAATEAIEFLSA